MQILQIGKQSGQGVENYIQDREKRKKQIFHGQGQIDECKLIWHKMH